MDEMREFEDFEVELDEIEKRKNVEMELADLTLVFLEEDDDTGSWESPDTPGFVPKMTVACPLFVPMEFSSRFKRARRDMAEFPSNKRIRFKTSSKNGAVSLEEILQICSVIAECMELKGNFLNFKGLEKELNRRYPSIVAKFPKADTLKQKLKLLFNLRNRREQDNAWKEIIELRTTNRILVWLNSSFGLEPTAGELHPVAEYLQHCVVNCGSRPSSLIEWPDAAQESLKPFAIRMHRTHKTISQGSGAFSMLQTQGGQELFILDCCNCKHCQNWEINTKSEKMEKKLQWWKQKATNMQHIIASYHKSSNVQSFIEICNLKTPLHQLLSKEDMLSQLAHLLQQSSQD